MNPITNITSHRKMSLQELTAQRLDELQRLAAENPFSVPVATAAEILHTSPELLRASMEQGRCPFGYAWKVGDRASYKIPTITFISWLTNGAIIRDRAIPNEYDSEFRLTILEAPAG